MPHGFRSSNTTINRNLTPGDNSLVMNKPTGTVSGDFMLMFIDFAAETFGGSGGTYWPSGWTRIGGIASSEHAYRIAGASEPSSYTVTYDSGLPHYGISVGTICTWYGYPGTGTAGRIVSTNPAHDEADWADQSAANTSIGIYCLVDIGTYFFPTIGPTPVITPDVKMIVRASVSDPGDAGAGLSAQQLMVTEQAPVAGVIPATHSTAINGNATGLYGYLLRKGGLATDPSMGGWAYT